MEASLVELLRERLTALLSRPKDQHTALTDPSKTIRRIKRKAQYSKRATIHVFNAGEKPRQFIVVLLKNRHDLVDVLIRSTNLIKKM